mgnify:CR=1 FL=1
MIYSHEVEQMCTVAQGVNHGAAPIPEEAKWVKAKDVTDISGLTHGIGWCAPQQGGCKLTLNVKEGIIQEALVETIGCSGMTHSAAMASEILPGRTILEALKTEHGFILSAKPTNPRKRDGQDTRLSDILVSPKRPTIAILFFRLFQTEKIERGKPLRPQNPKNLTIS